jgi:hypothetical protein
MSEIGGRITREHTVWCGSCTRWDHLESKRRPASQAREKGWKSNRVHGWLCPDCQRKNGLLDEIARESQELGLYGEEGR